MIEPTDEMIADAMQAHNATGAYGPVVAAVLAIVERDYEVRERAVWHLATRGDAHVHCCGRELLDLPRGDRWTFDPHGITCKGPYT